MEGAEQRVQLPWSPPSLRAPVVGEGRHLLGPAELVDLRQHLPVDQGALARRQCDEALERFAQLRVLRRLPLLARDREPPARRGPDRRLALVDLEAAFSCGLDELACRSPGALDIGVWQRFRPVTGLRLQVQEVGECFRQRCPTLDLADLRERLTMIVAL